jgi:hypothetical protein
MILDHRGWLRRFPPILAIALVACSESSPVADTSTTRAGPIPALFTITWPDSAARPTVVALEK